jgi:hypothetical protein
MGEAGSCSDVRPTFQMLGMTFNTSRWLEFEGESFVSRNGLAATTDNQHLPALVDSQQTPPQSNDVKRCMRYYPRGKVGIPRVLRAITPTSWWIP